MIDSGMLDTDLPAPDNSSTTTARGKGTTVDRVFLHLKEGILCGRYAPGQRLIEADLTRELEVSRGPLREAFRKLTAEGLVESVPNRGAIVRRLSHRETQELFQIRMALEALSARLAAENISDPEVRDRFEESIKRIWDNEPRFAAVNYLDENRVFHQAVADASGSERLSALCRQMQLPLIMMQLSGALTPETLALSNQEHRRIAKAILTGNPKDASAEMEAHLDRARRFAENLPTAIFRAPE
jgi:DNA-binding GntR family transcriptional regulator